ncbi:head-tail connector protein [Neobacillus drentensis]|uniref:head-tail connector protein n=1 Tax=Neobacillus drentensis TaxID=220684 RepID=UPI002FFEBA6D
MELTPEEVCNYLKVEEPEDVALVGVLTPAAISFCETKLKRPILDANMDASNMWIVPEEIRIAAYMLASHWFENRSPVGQVTQEIDFTINAILGPHRFRNV